LEVEVTYGSGKVKLNIPDANLAGIIAPKKMKAKPSVLDGLNQVLDNPHGQTLKELVQSKSVCVLVEDHTRDEPHRELISSIVPRLVDANNVQFIVTTGSHEVKHPANLEIVKIIQRIADDSHLSNYDVAIHDCFSDDLVELGKTSRNTPVIVDSKAIGHDVYVSISDMKAHYSFQVYVVLIQLKQITRWHLIPDLRLVFIHFILKKTAEIIHLLMI